MENKQATNIELEMLEELELMRANNRPLVINRSYFKITKNHNCAVVLSHLFYLYSNFGYKEFYKTNEELQEECCLSRAEFENARKKLIELDLIIFQKRGLPCKLYYKINLQVLVLLHKNLRKGDAQTRMRETGILDNISESKTSRPECEKVASIECEKVASIECEKVASTINKMNTHEYNMNKRNKKESLEDLGDKVKEIFEFWQEEVPGKKQSQLIPSREEAIIARLKEGYTVEQVKKAITNCSKSPFHNGVNDQGNLYNDLTKICDPEKIVNFIENVGAVARPHKNVALSPHETTEYLRAQGFVIT